MTSFDDAIMNSGMRPISDNGIKRLTTLLNLLPGLNVISAHGWHSEPIPDQGQVYDFSVEFKIQSAEQGLVSLAVVTQAADWVDEENISISTWINGDDPCGLMFTLLALNGVNPDYLVDAIGRVMIEINEIVSNNGGTPFTQELFQIISEKLKVGSVS